MTTKLSTPGSRSHDPPRRLTFSPLAWLKLQYLCHAGPTEVACFGLAAEHDPLRIDDVLVVRQRATPVTVAFDDEAVADLFDRMVDAGIAPARFARLWIHTHPGASVEPSGTDEETFHRVFGGCDWAVMAILGRTGNTFARLRFNAGPGGSLNLPVQVDWTDWPRAAPLLAELVAEWDLEYRGFVELEAWGWPEGFVRKGGDPSAVFLPGDPDDPFWNPFHPGDPHAFQ